MAIFQGKKPVQSKKSDVASNRNELYTISNLPDRVIISAPKMFTVKCKRTQYRVAEKLKIITRIQNGENQAQVSKDTSIRDSTIRGWLKEEPNLRSFFDETDTNAGFIRKRTKPARIQM